ncbi:MAG: HAMP domain-containing protein [Actinomycetota bacterium]|nr:HAMP domain-containing protein [Actinomycetota bacterium]
MQDLAAEREGPEPRARSGAPSAGRRISIERVWERLYSRAGVRYVETLTALMVGATLFFVVPGNTALLVPYFHATGGQYIRFVGAFEIAYLVAGVGIFVFALRRHAAVVRWVRGERSPQAAPAAWQSAVAALPGTTLIAMTWYSLCSIPPAYYVSEVAGPSGLGLLYYIVFLVFLSMGVAVFAFLYFEQALRPVVREIAVHLPPEFAPHYRGLSLGAKLLVLLPAINIFTGTVVAAVSTNSLGLEGRLAVTLAATVFVTLTVSLVLTLMFRESLLLRLKSLQEAIGRVDAGDFSARVLRLAGDELDEVGASFNGMVAGLQERRVLHDALGSYIDAGIATRVLSEGEILHGREVEVTVMFLDIRDFTSLADRSSPAEVVGYLSEFFDVVIPIVRAHHGHPNKLLGDGLLAVFGAPTPLEGHADHALEAAGEILQTVRRRYGGQLRVGIGLHTGEVIAGTIGGGGKLDYTLIGDTVNVAARVEELTKDTGDPLLITEATREQLSHPPGSIEPRGEHLLRGRERKTPIYAVEFPARERHRAGPALEQRQLSG